MSPIGLFLFFLAMFSAVYWRRKAQSGTGEVDRAALRSDMNRLTALGLLVAIVSLVVWILAVNLHWN